MESTDAKLGPNGTSNNKDCVKVAVNIRPLITAELLVGCTDCISVVPGEPQVQIGSHAFTFDHVYSGTSSSSYRIFEDCISPLVDAFFRGYNATVLAYGQTGSGKTYTMGTNYNTESNSIGIIPKVMENIFSKVEETKDNSEFLIRVSFIEIFKEEVFDLLEGISSTKSSLPHRAPIQIRETANGGISLHGVSEPEVRSKEEMTSFLSRGSISRATGSTNMNAQSSRSHAIFTISMEQKKSSHCSTATPTDEVGDDILCSKFHLVDLAGSERAKRTGADGLRLKEGIHINKGLLALGNVISALGDDKKRKEGGHVPYRDSKLTRLLQDSLGGNSKTVMIACVSPADSNAEETLNTLKYANRARNIQNKAIINHDPVTAQMQRMRSQLEQMQAELIYFRAEGGTSFEELQILRQKISLLEASNEELHRELRERKITCEHLAQCALDAQVEKDRLVLKIESARKGKSWDEIDSGDRNEGCELVKTYITKIQELEGELLRVKCLNNQSNDSLGDCLDLEDDVLNAQNAYVPCLDDFQSDHKGSDVSGEIDEVEKELEHSTLQEKLDKELKELDKRLEQKEAEMKRFGTFDTSVMKQHYEKKVQELEQEKRSLMKEIEDLRFNLANISSASDDGAQNLKEQYLQKLNILEAQVAELKKKQEAQSQILRQKQKSDEAAKRLQEEIQRIKSQKVQLQQKIKQESEQFRSYKASQEKKVLQLNKERRRTEYEMHKLMALTQRQKMVMQRKTEEASVATKRLKELLESKKTASRPVNGNGPGLQALMQTIEHELEVTVRVHEVRAEYERQMEARAAMANEVAKLKEEAEMLRQNDISKYPQTMSPGARNSRIFALENMLATSSSTLVSMASQLSEAEERERTFSGRGRWNQVRSLPEAKNLMNHLFNLASSSRCLVRDKELDCRERDSVIRELKGKIVRLTSLARQLEAQNQDLLNQQKLQKLIPKDSLRISSSRDGGHIYDLRKGPRNSTTFNFGVNNIELLEDMDTSESEQSGGEVETDQEWVKSDGEVETDQEWVKSGRRPQKKRSSKGSTIGHASASGSSNSEASASESLCCSCSKVSSCKTSKCECLAAHGFCGTACGCVSTKCTNRDRDSSELNGKTGCVDTESDTQTKFLASHGAMLLQSALSEKPVVAKNDQNGTQRRPLSDIGNDATIKSKAPRPSQRRKWRKSVIQLVPAVPSSQPESLEVPAKTQNNVVEDAVPLKLPRAMRSTALSDNPLRERNSDQADESTGKRDDSVVISRSPVRQSRYSDEKENHNS
ncbi:hypothetical protein Sjap_010502 [Stephania japonica]|uniref:Kinesin motor domain-containing protein n=1 Tax=Stephania japonica TaxID=461633 RepID=A0AAP0P6G9_9MAGN